MIFPSFLKPFAPGLLHQLCSWCPAAAPTCTPSQAVSGLLFLSNSSRVAGPQVSIREPPLNSFSEHPWETSSPPGGPGSGYLQHTVRNNSPSPSLLRPPPPLLFPGSGGQHHPPPWSKQNPEASWIPGPPSSCTGDQLPSLAGVASRRFLKSTPFHPPALHLLPYGMWSSTSPSPVFPACLFWVSTM